ncbi:MAG: Fe-S cluster assembly protein SufD [Acidobacteria bacterium]|nr:Fe-S cluster assembly protein SufD [Acidobacteriota bacterium]
MQAFVEKNPYTAGFEPLKAELRSEGEALRALREKALERFDELGFPTTKVEAWRNTNVSPIAQAAFPLATAAGAVTLEELEPHLYEGTERLVFVDGIFVPGLSSLELPPGGVALSLAEAKKLYPERVGAHLGRNLRFENQAFAALNTALHRDGLFFYLPKNTVVERPIQVLCVAATRRTAAYPRHLIVLEDNSQATLVESYVGLGDEEPYFTCPVTEVSLGANAVLDHYKIQREGLAAYHVAVQQSWQDRDSTLRSHSISIGGALVRNDLNGYLDGEGVSCTLNGLYLVDGKQHVDNHMRMDHAKPNGYSHELYKGVLNGSGRAVFNGLIHVHPDAQKTDAVQSNRNLLLSKNALAYSNPQLEIFADDVRCTHGSTIGQLDDDAVFYLRSRGIGEEAARSLLTYAFASDIVERIKVEGVRRDLEEYLFRRLPRGEVVRQAV